VAINSSRPVMANCTTVIASTIVLCSLSGVKSRVVIATQNRLSGKEGRRVEKIIMADYCAGQKAKTKDYWDSFYSALPHHASIIKVDFVTNEKDDCDDEVDGKKINEVVSSSTADLEWIVPNSAILDFISSIFTPSSQDSNVTVHVLEIGCGVSELSLSLLQRLLQQCNHQHACTFYDFVATDVSSVCIEHNKIRDDAFMSFLHGTAAARLSYEVLDVLYTNLQPHSKHIGRYDMILDKGTLDTFLFRSKRTNKGCELHPPLLMPLLNNIHRWLRSGCDAKYIIISPRSKIKSVRDFCGFKSVCRTRVDTTMLNSDDVVLVKGNCDNAHVKKSEVYLYVCLKDDSYDPDKAVPYRSMIDNIDDDSICIKCGMNFKQYRGTVDMKDQGEVVWTRRWRNHIVHCKG